MTIKQVASVFQARREGKGYRAICPVHKSKGATLALYADKDKVGVYCFAGCRKDDILSAVGLSWKELLYDYKPLDPEQRRQWAEKKRIEEQAALAERRHVLQLWLQSLRYGKPVVREKTQFERDIEAMCQRLSQ